MTATPRFIAPVPEQPAREATINYAGGSFTTTRGVLAQMFSSASFLSTCAFVEVERQRKSYTRTPYIGAENQIVAASSWTQKKYPNQTKSIAAGGEPIQIRINGEWWGGRLSGNHESFMAFLCDGKDELVGPIAWRSARGTLYGPIVPPSTED